MLQVLIGLFWPSMMALRARYVPEEQRSTIINIFRIPLNTFVCLILWKVRRGAMPGPVVLAAGKVWLLSPQPLPHAALTPCTHCCHAGQ